MLIKLNNFTLNNENKITNEKQGRFYDNKVVFKPWGYEYVVFKNEELCVTLLSINYNKMTSLHCHPKKKWIYPFKRKSIFSTWIKKREEHILTFQKNDVLDRFHSIKSISKNGLLALEFETPADKNDLTRYKDHMEEQKPYEGKKFTKLKTSSLIRFKRPKFGVEQVYS